MGSYGIDLSNNNGRVDLARAGIRPSFVFAKCTEGTTFTDPDYDYFASQAEDNDAQFGAYHFFHAEALRARAEAEHFMTSARPRSLLSLWVDYETYGASGQADAEEIGLFIETCKLMAPKAKVGVYLNLTGLSRIAPCLHEVPADAWWIAAWSSPPVIIRGSVPVRWQVHQYAVDGGIARDYSSWSAQQLAAFWKWE